MTAGTAPRVYLAGPEVFLHDAGAVLARKKEACAAHGLHGVSPFDSEVAAPEGGAATARAIFRANRAFMDGCDAAVANLTPFRSVSADAGTLFEVGYLCALGRPVFAYSGDSRSYAARVRAASADETVGRHSAEGWSVEDFGLAENLMVPFGVEESGGALLVAGSAAGDPFRDLSLFEHCLRRLAAVLVARG